MRYLWLPFAVGTLLGFGCSSDSDSSSEGTTTTGAGEADDAGADTAGDGAAGEDDATSGQGEEEDADEGVAESGSSTTEDDPFDSFGESGSTPDDPDELDMLADAVVGNYVFKLNIAQIQELPLGLGDANSDATSFGFAEVRLDGSEFTLVEHACRTLVTSDAGTTTTIADAVPQSSGSVETSIEVWQGEDSIEWSRGAEDVLLIGVMLDDPANDELPTDPDDPRVFDQDGDGNPGITVTVGGLADGDIYVIQRQARSYSGLVLSGRLLQAQVADRTEQAILASTNSLLEMDVPVYQNPDLSASSMLLQPVDEAYDCARVIAEIDTLFP